MGKRIVSGAVVTVLAAAAILAGGAVTAAVLFIVSCIAYRELCRAAGVCKAGEVNSLELLGWLFTLFYYGLVWQSGESFAVACTDEIWMVLFVLLIGILMLMMAVYVLTFPKYRSEQIMAAFFCMVYAPVMLSFIYLTQQMRYGAYIVWLIFISSWVCDTCAYFTGMLFGRHKMAPVLSPKKTIEGAVGGVAGSAIAGALFSLLLVEQEISTAGVAWAFAAISAAGAVISQIGDLAASAIKRNHEIKDYGTCIPGHGGIMDRFDSVIFTAPVIYVMAHILIGA